ncbi:MAG: putative 2OG-Fe(II) oxygenase [Opitutales bacterium]|nr:putative 2OG-Fe(II) oxygenase [Opitutales bacterium]
MDKNEFYLGQDRVLILKVPNLESWLVPLLNEFFTHRRNCRSSHKVNGRWENSYLDIDSVPSARIPMRFARTAGIEMLGIRPVLLFEPLSRSRSELPPFWFNIAKPGELTGLHDHAHLSILSAVVYLQADPYSGNLYFQKSDDIEVVPEPGKIVIFPPHVKHGVRINQSSNERISLAFNLFPFPLPNQDL